jgi:hypothetical protein
MPISMHWRYVGTDAGACSCRELERPTKMVGGFIVFVIGFE